VRGKIELFGQRAGDRRDATSVRVRVTFKIVDFRAKFRRNVVKRFNYRRLGGKDTFHIFRTQLEEAGVAAKTSNYRTV
jgi:uncharacterized protein YbcV (DUF1398 family)